MGETGREGKERKKGGRKAGSLYGRLDVHRLIKFAMATLIQPHEARHRKVREDLTLLMTLPWASSCE